MGDVVDDGDFDNKRDNELPRISLLLPLSGFGLGDTTPSDDAARTSDRRGSSVIGSTDTWAQVGG